ncbi:MAG: hypothetical protein AAB965_01770, partial [Patescibacteria group bacterium]
MPMTKYFKFKPKILIFLLLISFLRLGHTVESAPNATGSVIVNVEVVKNIGAYQYAYEIFYKSTDATLPPIGVFRVDLRHNPSAHRLIDFDPEQESWAEHMRQLNETPRVYPTRKLAPIKWDHTNVFQTPYHGWWSCPMSIHKECLQPGHVLKDFIFMALEPPGVRGYVVEASDGLDSSFETSGHTIAPVAPPDPFTVSTWTARMQSDVVEARKQSWIKTDKGLKEIQDLISALNMQDKKKLKKAVKVMERYAVKELKAGS